ncbi:glucosaminidase domain-containing protein [Paenibacillus athensensis]|uniref:Mannosyl-glycoprotein endo-beta-N-acetylglucosamidase-like domain-containing protein n=1 Tax=Paenibacillus athensensis TaxID=1967502 RepID=A0A4Y8Q5K1_9BACL|nr:glucosaminidase domain-containing protein [Paenibacillus athensensis]MCD1259474.1 glucosaminidase domain-containing protein [Paenibacillus athensensis]
MRKEDFLHQIMPSAMQAMQRYGILASVLVAQAIIESKWGNSVYGNNIFGLKDRCMERSTLEFVDGVWVRVLKNFRVYKDWEGSVHDYAKSLSTSPEYSQLLYEMDYRKACTMIQDIAGMAAAGYADKLICLIEENHLYQYDRVTTEGLSHFEMQGMSMRSV